MSGKTIIIEISGPAYGGISIGRYNGKVVMVKGSVLPGETVEVAIAHEKKDYLSASALRVLESSPDRVRPFCRYFGECGGCHLQHVSYSRQTQLKEEILRDCLRRLTKIDIDLSSSVTDSNPWNYRLRGQFKVSKTGTGFYREKTRGVVDVENCPVMADEINEALQEAKVLMNEATVKEIHITMGDSLIGLIKSSAYNEPTAYWDRLSSLFLESGFSGIFVERKKNKLLKYGAPFTTLSLSGLQYTISPMSFFQGNWKLNTVLVHLIKDTMGPLKGLRVLDLFAGAGNFSIPLGADAEVVAVEENPFSIEDGRRNLDLNKVGNFRFIHSTAEQYRPEESFDILILDPPRQGLTKKTMNNVLSMLPGRIVYISCNPATFARDLKKLLEKYGIESIRMIDFFPQTFHVEAMAILRLR
jgi:23S rRNA (uracil1939-C5)-methyltransferase